MRFSHPVPLARLAAGLSVLSVVAVVACSDASTATPRLGVGSAALDKGKGKDGQGDQNNQGNRGPGNQNNPKDTANQNNDQRVKLEARLMPVAGDTTFRGAEGNAEFEQNDRDEIQDQRRAHRRGDRREFLRGLNHDRVGNDESGRRSGAQFRQQQGRHGARRGRGDDGVRADNGRTRDRLRKILGRRDMRTRRRGAR